MLVKALISSFPNHILKKLYATNSYVRLLTLYVTCSPEPTHHLFAAQVQRELPAGWFIWPMAQYLVLQNSQGSSVKKAFQKRELFERSQHTFLSPST